MRYSKGKGGGRSGETHKEDEDEANTKAHENGDGEVHVERVRALVRAQRDVATHGANCLQILQGCGCNNDGI